MKETHKPYFFFVVARDGRRRRDGAQIRVMMGGLGRADQQDLTQQPLLVVHQRLG